MTFKLITWNINSVRRRLELVERLMAEHNPDVICLQETKCADDCFPLEALHAMGFAHIQIHGQKAYHGVATLSRHPLERMETRDFDGSGDTRHLAVKIILERKAPVTLHNFYVPAGGDVPDVESNDKFRRKLDFLTNMAGHFGEVREAGKHGHMILVGDLNVAPLESDVWSHKQLLKVVSHTPVEVDHLNEVQAAGDWRDVMRRHVPADEKLFTWWSYRARDWRASNRGRRLDHVWCSPCLEEKSRSMDVLDDVRSWDLPSDHAPVLVQFDLG